MAAASEQEFGVTRHHTEDLKNAVLKILGPDLFGFTIETARLALFRQV